MSADTTFAVLQLDRERDPMALATALASIRGTPVQDQVLAAKAAWGIVEEALPEAEARELGRALRAAGVECAVGRTSSIVTPPTAESIRSTEALPDEAPTMIAVAAVTVVTTSTTKQEEGPSPGQKAASTAIMMATGLPIKLGGRKRKVEKTREEQSLSFYADLFYDDARRRMRIDASAFDFSSLGARMTYQGLANLRALIGDVAGAAPAALRNRGAHVLLEGLPIRTMGYASLEDLEREERWLLTLRRAGL